MSGRARQSGKTLIQIRKRRGRLGATHGYWPGRKVSTQLLAHLIPVRSCTRVRGSVGIPNPRESGSVIRADRQRSGPSCVLLKGVPQGQTESGGIVLAAICWATSAQGRCHQEEAFCLPTFSHLLIVNKLLSLSPLMGAGTQKRALAYASASFLSYALFPTTSRFYVKVFYHHRLLKALNSGCWRRPATQAPASILIKSS